MWFEAQRYITNGYSKGGFEEKLILLNRGIYLDVAPLFLLVIGHYDKIKGTKLLKNFDAKRITKNRDRNYNQSDYRNLLAFLNSLKLHQQSLLITPHIFTEFIKHVWEIVDNKTQFKEIIKNSFKPKWYVKDSEKAINYSEFFNEDEFINKEFEIGDISICICIKKGKQEINKPIAILTDDGPLAVFINGKYDSLTIYYTEISTGTTLLKPENIPKELLIEPIES